MIRRWLLIEHPGPWPVEALATPDFPDPLRLLLQTTARGVAGRVLLIRRPGRADRSQPPASRAFAVVVDGGTHWGRWSRPEDLEQAVQALRDPPRDLRPDPILLVCAHGVHDTCCAVRGRPTAATLSRRWPAATWECTHVGGDRFAPNVVVLPDGTYYGYLDPGVAVDVIERHLAGVVSAPYLRGLTRYPPPAQVALGTAHRRWGPFGVGDVDVLDVRQPGRQRWEIDLEVPGQGRQTLSIAGSARPAARLTCRAAQETSALDYVVL